MLGRTHSSGQQSLLYVLYEAARIVFDTSRIMIIHVYLCVLKHLQQMNLQQVFSFYYADFTVFNLRE